MGEKPSDSVSFAGLLLSIISSWNLLLKTLVGVIGIFGAVFAAVILFSQAFRWLQPPVEVTVKDTGAVVITPPRSNHTAMFLLSANGGEESPWVNTGIEISDGQKYTVKASGRVCLGFHHMVAAAGADKLPPLPWIGPDGLRPATTYPPRSTRPEERDRADYLIEKNLPQGRLIGVISSDIPKPNPPAEDILNIGTKRTDTAKVKEGKGVLWLTVNDIWLDETRAKAYTGRTEKEFKEKIANNRYWNIWYDDNAGSFLVIVELEP